MALLGARPSRSLIPGPSGSSVGNKADSRTKCVIARQNDTTARSVVDIVQKALKHPAPWRVPYGKSMNWED